MIYFIRILSLCFLIVHNSIFIKNLIFLELVTVIFFFRLGVIFLTEISLLMAVLTFFVCESSVALRIVVNYSRNQDIGVYL